MPVFPPTNHWNLPVDKLPVAQSSNRLVRAMGPDENLFADFSIPFTTVSKKQPKVRVSFQYKDESDKGPYPIPNNVPIEKGSDRHVVIVDRDRCRLYELYDAEEVVPGKRWRAGSGAIWNMRSNRMRPAGWTSADAAGLPIFPGLARYEEVKRGVIDHAIRFTADETRASYIYPARHFQGHDRDPDLPPMGMRMRLKANVDISGFPPQARVILQALKKYGMIQADEGKAWFISGAPSPGWSEKQLQTLGRIKGSDFEEVDTRSLPRVGLGGGKRHR